MRLYNILMMVFKDQQAEIERFISNKKPACNGNACSVKRANGESPWKEKRSTRAFEMNLVTIERLEISIRLKQK